MNRKLTVDEVTEILALHLAGYGPRVISRNFGLSKGGVEQIVTRKNWAWVEMPKEPSKRRLERFSTANHGPRPHTEKSIARYEDRFWQRVTKRDDGCWIYRYINKRNGYGVAKFDGVSSAHRVAWRLANGPIPAGMFVCHRCDVRPCVNPAHLFLGTHTDNVRDMHAKGRARNQHSHAQTARAHALAAVDASKRNGRK